MTKDNLRSLDAARLKRVAEAAQRAAESMRRMAKAAKRRPKGGEVGL